MNILEALRLTPPESIAFVGAGGKTSCMFCLAHLQPPPVLVTTTTKLATDQIEYADSHLILDDSMDLSEFFPNNPVTLFSSGLNADKDRVLALSPANLEKLRSFSLQNHLPLLIEADGAKQRPFKAPAAHEPVIPPWIEHVIVVVGLGVIGQTLSSAHVFWPELVSQLAQVEMGSIITLELIADVLKHSLGGLKAIPGHATRTVLLNQSDTANLRPAQLDAFARRLDGAFDQIVIGSCLREKEFQIIL